MKWFIEFMKKYSIAPSTSNLRSNYLQYEVPPIIDNSNLISQEFMIFKNSTETDNQKSYIDKLLKDGLKLNIDYTIVGYEMFKHIHYKLGYGCNNIICRFGHFDDSSEEIKIEINLQKVRVLTVPDWHEHTDFEVIQFSKYDTVNDLYSRLIDTDSKYKSHKLLKVTCDKEFISNAIKNYKYYSENGGEFNYQIDDISPSDDCVMSLELDDESLLIVENILSCKAKTSPPSLKIPQMVKSKENCEIKLKGKLIEENKQNTQTIKLFCKEILLEIINCLQSHINMTQIQNTDDSESQSIAIQAKDSKIDKDEENESAIDVNNINVDPEEIEIVITDENENFGEGISTHHEDLRSSQKEDQDQNDKQKDSSIDKDNRKEVKQEEQIDGNLIRIGDIEETKVTNEQNLIENKDSKKGDSEKGDSEKGDCEKGDCEKGDCEKNISNKTLVQLN